MTEDNNEVAYEWNEAAYEWVAVMDNDTCDECAAMHGKKYTIEEVESFLSLGRLPFPMHPPSKQVGGCRCFFKAIPAVPMIESEVNDVVG